MTSRKISRRHIQSACAEPGPGDGLDPRLEPRGETSSRVPNRKALQLCGQVAETLALVLSGECGDELLRDLLVESVVPAPNSSRLLVTVSMPASAGDEDAGRALERLEHARGKLRGEVATAVHRRRVPDLLFRVVTRRS
jgi:ribosome-binding factor A